MESRHTPKRLFLLLFALLLTSFVSLAQNPKQALNDPLGEAARKGDATAVSALLDQGADVNTKFRYGTTALFKAADICVQDPERVARYLVDKGYEKRYEIALEVLKDLPYCRWREDNPEDSVCFYALRLHEVKIIKASL